LSAQTIADKDGNVGAEGGLNVVGWFSSTAETTQQPHQNFKLTETYDYLCYLADNSGAILCFNKSLCFGVC